MIFKESKPIYLQIADRICDEILQGIYHEGERIPSVREYAAMVEVNANTAMRAFDFLQNQSVITMKRGIGYYVSYGAGERILAFRREAFYNEELFDFFHQIYTLGFSMEEMTELYRKYEQSMKQNSGTTENESNKIPQK